MKKIMLSLALSGLMLTGFAQEKKDTKAEVKEIDAVMHGHRDRGHKDFKNKTPEEVAKIKTDRMDQKLKFTDKQREEVYAFHLKQAQDHKKIAAERKLYREKMRRQRKADHEKMMSLLTPEQQQTLKDAYAENRKTHSARWRKDKQMRSRDFKKENAEKVSEAEQKTT
jgi:periplasmic protein CpxP/Spy